MESTSKTPMNTAGESPATGWKTYAAAGAFCALLAGNGFMMWRTSNLESQVAQLNAVTSTEIGALRQAANTQAMEARKTIAEISQQIEQTQTSGQKYAAQQARVNADRAMAKASRKNEELMNTLAEQRKKEQAEITEQLGAVKMAADQNSAKVGEVATDVTAVKSEVAKTKTDLDQTIADLKSVRGDLGVQSGLIATNSKELEALKALGERNYFEFNIAKANGTVKLGNVAVALKKADVKRNKFNLDLVADDKRIEKKDKTINEPVQFYVAGSRQPYELVVNQVTKDRIAGYLATPKTVQARR